MTTRRITAACAAAVLAACTPRAGSETTRAPATAVSASAAAPRCDYDVTVARATAMLDVTARCRGARVQGFTGDGAVLPFTSAVRDAHGAPIPRSDAGFVVPASDDVTIRYRVDLDAAAHELENFDTALAVGRSLIAPLSSYALAPDPIPPGGSGFVRVHALPDAAFLTELRTAGDGFSVGLSELPFSTYGVFGRFERTRFSLPGVHGPATLDVVSLDAEFAVPRDARDQWVLRAARAVATYYGGFPVDRAGILVTPSGGHGVPFGKVLPAGGGTIVLLLGSHATQAEMDGAWVLVHELFHLGFPSFVHEGMWLDEGLATYVEPLIRARAGSLTEEQGWAEVIRDMPLGVKLCETVGLEHFTNVRSVYWGGAVVALLADVEARRRTHGARGLEDALRAVLAEGGDATRVMRVADVIRRIDEVFGSAVLAPLAAAYADHGSPVPLDAVLADLGVERLPGGVRLHDDAPLAAIRRIIMYGSPTVPTMR